MEVGRIIWVANDRQSFPAAHCCLRSRKQALGFLVPAAAEEIPQ